MRPFLYVTLWLALVGVVVACDCHLRTQRVSTLELVPVRPLCDDGFATDIKNNCWVREC